MVVSLLPARLHFWVFRKILPENLHSEERSRGRRPPPEIRANCRAAGCSAFGYRNLELSARPAWNGPSRRFERRGAFPALGQGRHSRIRALGAGSRANQPGSPRACRVESATRLHSPGAAGTAGEPGYPGILDAESHGSEIAYMLGKAAIRLAPTQARIRGNLVPFAASLRLGTGGRSVVAQCSQPIFRDCTSGARSRPGNSIRSRARSGWRRPTWARSGRICAAISATRFRIFPRRWQGP